MKIFLRYVGDPGYQNGVAEDIRMHRNTVFDTIWQVTQSIVEQAENWIKFPLSTVALQNAKEEWQEL